MEAEEDDNDDETRDDVITLEGNKTEDRHLDHDLFLLKNTHRTRQKNFIMHYSGADEDQRYDLGKNGRLSVMNVKSPE